MNVQAASGTSASRYRMRGYAAWLMAGTGTTCAAAAAGGFLSSQPVVGALFAVLSALLLWGAVMPVVVLTDSAVRSRQHLGAMVIPLEEIAGVGLVFRRSGTGAPVPMGWYLTVWPVNGMPELTAISYVPFIRSYLHPGRNAAARFLASDSSRTSSRTPFGIDSFDPVRETDLDKLAATYAAGVARAIYQRALARQGPSGYLASREEQKHVSAVNPPVLPGLRNTYSVRRNVAFWSPDGEIGYAASSQMPMVLGLRVGIAEAHIKLAISRPEIVIERRGSRTPPDFVAAQDPGPGAVLMPGSLVTLTVSVRPDV